MTDWQLTATTIFCEDMNDEVTIMVYKDGKAKCTGYDTFIKQGSKKSGRGSKNRPQCDGPVCHRVSAYKDKLFSEENQK